MTHAPLCARCTKNCRQPKTARVIRCPQFIAKGGDANEKIVADPRRNKESIKGAGRLAPVDAGTEEEENQGGTSESAT